MRKFLFLTLLSVCGLAMYAQTLETRIKVYDRASLVTSGGFDPVEDLKELDKEEVAAAKKLYIALEQNDMKQMRDMISVYQKLKKKNNDHNINGYIIWLISHCVDKKSAFSTSLEKTAYTYFTKNSYKTLKYFLSYMYRFGNMEVTDPKVIEMNLATMMNLMELGPQNRNNITDMNRVLALLNLKNGEIVCDLGCGAGTFSEAFSKKIGADGTVYALDTNEGIIQYLRSGTEEEKISNIFALKSSETNLGLLPNSCDVVFISSVYGGIYVFYKDLNRIRFLRNVRSVLRDKGRLVIVDNYPVGLKNRSFFGKYTVDPHLIAAQLKFFGFEMSKLENIGKGQYYLELKNCKKGKGTVPYPAIKRSVQEEEKMMMQNPTSVPVTMADTPLHIMGADTFDLMPRGIEAADLAFKAFQKKDKQYAQRAIAIYDKLIPVENFGGEYTAIRLLLKYTFGTEAERKKLNPDPFTDSYFEYLLGNNAQRVIKYLDIKYFLTKKSKEDLGKNKVLKDFLEDFVLLNNPVRREWAQTAKYVKEINVKKKDIVADIGCGPGYYSVILSEMVGSEGKVLALDLKKGHLDFIDKYTKKNKISNIKTINNRIDSLTLPKNSVDVAFICSLYHVLYSENLSERDAFLADIKNVLRPGGRFIIIDNSPMDGDMQYHSNYIDKHLIVSQLYYYGFRLKKYRQFIPQRFLLEFEKVKE